MADPSPNPPKAALRADALRRRRAFAASLTPNLRNRLEAQLAEHVVPYLGGAGTIAFYHPLKDEIGAYPLLDRLAEGVTALLPWFADRDSRMIFRRAPAVTPSPWGVLQPAADAEAMAPDLVLVPLVHADRNCNRIGHGKGHYDRALAHLRAGGHAVRTIGLAWDVQIGDAPIPADPWDQPLDAIATPSEWITPP